MVEGGCCSEKGDVGHVLKLKKKSAWIEIRLQSTHVSCAWVIFFQKKWWTYKSCWKNCRLAYIRARSYFYHIHANHIISPAMKINNVWNHQLDMYIATHREIWHRYQSWWSLSRRYLLCNIWLFCVSMLDFGGWKEKKTCHLLKTLYTTDTTCKVLYRSNSMGSWISITVILNISTRKQPQLAIDQQTWCSLNSRVQNIKDIQVYMK